MHIAAVLPYIDTSTSLNGETTCSQQKCQWILLIYQRERERERVLLSTGERSGFDFCKGKKRKRDDKMPSCLSPYWSQLNHQELTDLDPLNWMFHLQISVSVAQNLPFFPL